MPVESFDPHIKRSIINNIKFTIHNFNYSRLGSEVWHYDEINEPFNRLYLVTGGRGTIEHEGRCLVLQKGFAYLVPRDITLTMSCEDYVEKFWVNFSVEAFPGFDYCRKLPFGICKPYESSLVEELRELSEKDSPMNMLKIQNLLLQAVIALIDPYEGLLESDLTVMIKYRPLYEHIEKNCTAGLKVQDLAEMMGISSNALYKDFRKDTGFSIKEYLNRKIIDRAKQSLAFTGLRVSEIAAELGFNDSFYFSRFFKKRTGLSPRAYRESQLP